MPEQQGWTPVDESAWEPVAETPRQSQPMTRSRTGALYAAPTESGLNEFASGVVDSLNPMNVVRLARSAWSNPTDTAVEVGKNLVMAPIRMAGGMLNEPAKTLGQATGMMLMPLASKGAGAALKAAAPELMDMGLQRTLADRLEFPNTPQRLVDMRLVPRGTNVREALNATEQRVDQTARSFDAAAQARGLARPALPEGQIAVPLGEAPTPQGGTLGVANADAVMRPMTRAAIPSADRSGLDALLTQDVQLGPTAQTIPPRVMGATSNDVRLASTIGQRANVAPTDALYGPSRAAGIDWEPQYLHSPVPDSTGDVVAGNGTVLRPMNAPPGRGGVPNMVDPQRLADEASNYAYRTGKIGGLGDVPGQAAQELDQVKNRYLAQNTRPRSLAETIEQKRAYQQRANYPSRPNAPVSSDESMNFNKGIAAANRKAAIELAPTLENDLAQEQDLIGADVARAKLDSKSVPLSTVGTVKSALMLRNPTVMGNVAITADQLGGLLRNPWASRALIMSALSQQPGNEAK